ncbi:thioredoxin family protein [Nonomuraea sp. H19]|uniref:thioredoxin family protein n=1 Tax=Nonomuraea sp. H19 TaxID=3452206 RepID=UPI003F899224
MSAVVKVTTKEQFHQLLRDNRRVVAMFTATWSGPCRAITIHYEKFSNLDKFSGIRFLTADVDDVADLVKELHVRNVPTFYFYREEEKLHDLVAPSPQALEEALALLHDV